MKGLILGSIICFLIVNEVVSQNIFDAEFPSSIDSSDEIKKYVEGIEFDLYIGYFNNCNYWSTRKGERKYFAIIYKDDIWKSCVYASKKGKKLKKKKEENLSKKDVSVFINLISQNKIWALRNDSLKWRERPKNDSIIEVKYYGHGCTDRFYIIRDNSYVRIHCYEAEELQSFVFVHQRQIFIEIRNKFLELFNDD